MEFCSKNTNLKLPEKCLRSSTSLFLNPKIMTSKGDRRAKWNHFGRNSSKKANSSLGKGIWSLVNSRLALRHVGLVITVLSCTSAVQRPVYTEKHENCWICSCLLNVPFQSCSTKRECCTRQVLVECIHMQSTLLLKIQITTTTRKHKQPHGSISKFFEIFFPNV